MQRRRAIEVPRTPALTASPCSRPANGRAQDGVPHIAHVGATAQSERMPHLMDDHIAEAGRIQNPHERPDNDVSLDDGSNGRAHAWRQARLSLGPRPLGRAEHRPGHIEPNLIASGTQIPGAATGAVSGIASPRPVPLPHSKSRQRRGRTPRTGRPQYQQVGQPETCRTRSPRATCPTERPGCRRLGVMRRQRNRSGTSAPQHSLSRRPFRSGAPPPRGQ